MVFKLTIKNLSFKNVFFFLCQSILNSLNFPIFSDLETQKMTRFKYQLELIIYTKKSSLQNTCSTLSTRKNFYTNKKKHIVLKPTTFSYYR